MGLFKIKCLHRSGLIMCGRTGLNNKQGSSLAIYKHNLEIIGLYLFKSTLVGTIGIRVKKGEWRSLLT